VLEEIRFYLQESPDLVFVLGFLGVACLVALVVLLTRFARRRLSQQLVELPLTGRFGRWIGRNPDRIVLGIGVIFILLSGAALVNPVRLVKNGESTEALVTDVVERTVRDSEGKTEVESTFTISFNAGDRKITIRRTDHRIANRTSFCIVNCLSKGERLRVRYLADQPDIAEIDSFSGLFGNPLLFGVVGSVFVFVSRKIAKKKDPADSAQGKSTEA